MNALKCRTLSGLHAQNASQVALYTYTGGSAIALTRAVHMLVLPHAVISGASLYIEQEKLIAGKPE